MDLHPAKRREVWANAVLSRAKAALYDLEPNGHQVSASKVVASLQSITCGYHRRPVFRDLTLTFHAGQLTGLVGPTGSGKTTLLKALLGLVRPWQGQVQVFGAPVTRAT